MKLTTTNDKLQIVLGGAITTSQLQCLTTYKVYTSSSTSDGKIAINTNNTTDVDLAGAPTMGGTSTTGLTTALPATAAAPGTVTTSFWGCVS